MPSPYNIVYSFGDSLSDAGNAWLLTDSPAFTTSLGPLGSLGSITGAPPQPVSPPYAAITYAGGITGDVFSNGPTSVQNISNDLGLGLTAPSGVGVPASTLNTVVDNYVGSVAGPAAVAAIEALPGVSVSGSYVSLVSGAPGGTDFAIGGAVTGFTAENGVGSELTDLNSQLATFEHDVPTPSPTALYTVSIGSNDLLNLLEDPNFSTYSMSQDIAAVAASVINEDNFVQSLINDGAKNILVQNVPDLSKTPEIMDNYPTEVAAASTLAAIYDNALMVTLGTLTGAAITIEDEYTLIDEAVGNPSIFGLSNVTSPVYSGPFSSFIPADLVSSDPSVQDTYLFFDHLHPTETGQVALANQALLDLGLSPPCFVEGTLIATARGPVPIEALRVGDSVPTVLGGSQRVIWTGRRGVDCRRHPSPREVWPVRVRAGAFGKRLPSRDLYLSPDHAIHAEGVLIPVKYLIDGDAVAQIQVDRITYWHVELPRHDVILAEGLPAETYLDTGQRSAFEGETAIALHPDFCSRLWEARGCAPLVVCGPEVERIKARLRRAA